LNLTVLGNVKLLWPLSQPSSLTVAIQISSPQQTLEFSAIFKQYRAFLPSDYLALMDMARIFGLPAALLIVAVGANRFSRWTRVPDIIV